MHDSGTLDAATATIRFERTLPGPILRVWSYLTDGDRLATWLTKSGEVPPDVGASFVLRMTGDDDMPEREGYEAKTYGTVLAYDAPHVLEYTWGVRGDDGTTLESVVRFELETSDDGTVALTLTHRGVIIGFESRTLGGWHALLDALRARLEGGEPRPMLDAFRAIESRYREAGHVAR